MRAWDREIDRAAAILSQATRATASSGAGVSAESGIPTFRDPGGLWDRLDPMTFGTPDGFMQILAQDPSRVIQVFSGLLDTFERAEPNKGHIALGELEQMGILKTVITQNVDNLHQEAGNTCVIEVHGNLFRMECLVCREKYDFERRPFIREFRRKLDALKVFTASSMVDLAPVCKACGSIMRPDVVLFGEAVQCMAEASVAAMACDVMLVLGTSGSVYPAANLPREAHRAGAVIININPTEDAFAEITNLYIAMNFAEAMPAIVRRIRERAA